MNNKKDVKGFLEFVYEFYKSMKAHEITLVYEGEITHQITKAFTSLTESNMSKDDEPNSVQRKVFHVMVECCRISVNMPMILHPMIIYFPAGVSSWSAKGKMNTA